MRKAAIPSKWFDRVHKGFVMTCVGLTLYGFSIIGSRAYHYYFVEKPAKLELQESEEKVDSEELKA